METWFTTDKSIRQARKNTIFTRHWSATSTVSTVDISNYTHWSSHIFTHLSLIINLCLKASLQLHIRTLLVKSEEYIALPKNSAKCWSRLILCLLLPFILYLVLVLVSLADISTKECDLPINFCDKIPYRSLLHRWKPNILPLLCTTSVTRL